jgi:hypothetical protein
MAAKQAILNKREEKVYDAVKAFLEKNKVINEDGEPISDYAMVKYCIARTCREVFTILEKNKLGLNTIGLTSEDLVNVFRPKKPKKK